MVVMTAKGEDFRRSAERIADFEVILAARDLSDTAPRLGRIDGIRIVHPLRDLVAERRDVPAAGESLAPVVVGDRIGLERAIEGAVVHRAMVAKNTAPARGQNDV